jgi:hypothetical protein
MDQFTPLGDFSVFFIPDSEFNQYPEDNTSNHYDVFNDPVCYREESSDAWDYEIGGRWKKTFGQSDVSLMAPYLLEHENSDPILINQQILFVKQQTTES